jgi:large subunit ribosomal protein L10
MNKERKTAVVEEIATQIKESEAIFAVDYRGISVPQAAELRARLGEAGARFRVVKNTLTERAADEAGAETLKEMLDGPTAFTFVAADGGDVALAAKALAQFRRANEVLEFKGGVMSGEPLTIEQIEALAKLPGVEVLRGQLVGVLASPITGLVRGMSQLIAGLAIALGQARDEGKLGTGEAAAEAEAPAPAQDSAPTDEAGEGEAPAEEPAAEADAPAEEAAPRGDSAPAAEAGEGEGSAEEAAPEEAAPPAEDEPPPPDDGPDAGEAGAEAPATDTETDTATDDDTPSGEEKEG